MLTLFYLQFVGYLVGQVPSNILLTRVKPSRYIPVAIFIWGGISMCAAATHNFTGIIVVRVLLGFAESPFFPGALYVDMLLLTPFIENHAHKRTASWSALGTNPRRSRRALQSYTVATQLPTGLVVYSPLVF